MHHEPWVNGIELLKKDIHKAEQTSNRPKYRRLFNTYNNYQIIKGEITIRPSQALINKTVPAPSYMIPIPFKIKSCERYR